MADIRINALATTAASTASDDFVAVDGSANGTRKLNAYSPTFGGDVGVGGATYYGYKFTVDGPALALGLGIAKTRGDYVTTITNPDGGITSTNVAFKVANAAGTMLLQSTYGGNATIGGNLTVSGTGNSTFAGNVGINTTPSSWSLLKGLQVSGDAFFGGFSGNTYIGNNWVYDGADKYISNGYATKYYQNTGSHVWQTAASGTAGNAITFSTAMQLASSGNLLIGTTTDSANGKFQLATHTTSAGGIGFGTATSLYTPETGVLITNALSGTTAGLRLFHSSAQKAQFLVDGSGLYVDASAAGGSIILRTNAGTTALTLDSSQRTILSGALRLNNAYTASVIVPTGYVTIQDSTGTTYKVAVSL